MEVIVGINEIDFNKVLEKIEVVNGFGNKWIHLDIGDGDFGSVHTWSNPNFLNRLPIEFSYEIHYMVEDTDNTFKDWLKSPVKRFIFHNEAVHDPIEVRDVCRKKGIEPGLAFVFNVSREEIKKYANEFNFFQVLAVEPGKSNQIFNNKALEIVSHLRELNPDAKIEVDGGVTEKTAPDIKEAGATVLASTSYILKSDNPKEAFNILKNI